jgi:hypothetical protein
MGARRLEAGGAVVTPEEKFMAALIGHLRGVREG